MRFCCLIDKGNIPIAIEVSGDGVLPLDATLPGSTNPTALESLNVFLSSIPFGQNLTVSPQGLLTQEPGSTVKHLNFQVGNYSCLQPGTYNVLSHDYREKILMQSCRFMRHSD